MRSIALHIGVWVHVVKPHVDLTNRELSKHTQVCYFGAATQVETKSLSSEDP